LTFPVEGRSRGFQGRISEDPPTLLIAEQLRDGRIALGTRARKPNGDWEPGEVHFLEPTVYLDFASWLADAVEAGWIETVRQRQAGPIRTAGELHGEGPGALSRLAFDTLAEIPPDLLARAMILLANAMGPHARERLVERLNETPNRSEDLELRRRIADENETFAYAIAAAALFDAMARGIYPEDLGDLGE
jgi:hypothetical protein